MRDADAGPASVAAAVAAVDAVVPVIAASVVVATLGGWGGGACPSCPVRPPLPPRLPPAPCLPAARLVELVQRLLRIVRPHFLQAGPLNVPSLGHEDIELACPDSCQSLRLPLVGFVAPAEDDEADIVLAERPEVLGHLRRR